MPIDPTIPLQARVAPIANPFQLLSRFAEDQEQRAIRDEARQDRADARTRRRKDEADAQAVKDVFAKTPRKADGSPDSKRIAGELQGIDPKAALDWWNRATDEEKYAVAKQKETAAQVAQAAGAILGVAPERRAQAYAQARGEWIARGQLKPEQAPELYDEAWLTTKHREALTVAQQIEHAEKLVDQEIARNKQPDKNFATHQMVDGKGNQFEAAYESNSDHWTRGGQDITVDVAAGRIKRYVKPESDPSDSHWRDVEETLPDGTTITRSQRVKNGDVVKTRPPVGAVTRAQRNQALRWKEDELGKLEARITNGDFGDARGGPGALDVEAIEEIKLRIQNGYRAQLGMAPETVLGEEWRRRGPRTENAGGGGQPRSPFPGAGGQTSDASTPQRTASGAPNNNQQQTPQTNIRPMPAHGNGNGGRSNQVTVTAPNGKVYTFPNEGAAIEFKRQAGIQ